MKKRVYSIVIAVLAVTVMCGCGSQKPKQEPAASQEEVGSKNS